MGNYEVYSTASFDKVYAGIDSSEQTWIQKIKSKLETSITGKILNFNWFREKKHNNKRLYFIVDEERKRILLVAFASKKAQRQMIEFVRQNMEDLFRYLKEF